MNIPFSPPDITEEEIEAVAEVLRSGWITTGPKTKDLEKRLAAYIDTGRTDLIDLDEYENRVVTVRTYDGMNYTEAKKSYNKVKKECYAMV